MSIKKITIAGIAGGVAAFLIGWLIYGILLKDFMTENFNNSIMRPETDFIWWAMIASNLLWGIFIAFVFNRWAAISTLGAGFSGGAIISLFIGLTYSLSFYAMSTMYNDMTALAVDIIVGTLMGGIIGAVVGFVLGKIKD